MTKCFFSCNVYHGSNLSLACLHAAFENVKRASKTRGIFKVQLYFVTRVWDKLYFDANQ